MESAGCTSGGSARTASTRSFDTRLGGSRPPPQPATRQETNISLTGEFTEDEFSLRPRQVYAAGCAALDFLDPALVARGVGVARIQLERLLELPDGFVPVTLPIQRDREIVMRSEERRVGKERRSTWTPESQNSTE